MRAPDAPISALALFREQLLDTLQIAKFYTARGLRITEAEVLRIVHLERDADRAEQAAYKVVSEQESPNNYHK